ncbi:MAG: peptidase E [Christensenellaceae bacterium]
MDKYLIAIGGGEIKNKTTLKIDEYIANLAKLHAGEKRANALFFGTASHDSMPYFNSFRKTYTSVFDIKAEVGLLVYGEMDMQKIKDKIDAADCIYVGGGDTVFMLDLWKKKGVDKLLINAYNQGKIICGLSAGAICWFSDMYTDYEIMRGQSASYSLHKGLGLINGLITPHFDERIEDFTETFINSEFESAYAIENDAAIVFKNGTAERALSSGGKAYILKKDNGKIERCEIE